LALVHAAGQILAHPQSDDLLQQLIDLFKNHEQKLARLVGVALEIKELSDKHPEAVLDRKAFVWDHTAQVVAKMTAVTQGDPTGALNRPWNHDETSLIEDIVLSLANPRSDALDDVYSKFFIYRDEMNYDPNNVNGPAVNRTSGDGQPPHILVDRSKPITGNNKSMFMRSLNVVFDSTRTKACNRAGAQVHLKAGVLGLKLDMTYPSDVLFRGLCIGKVKNPLDWCDIFEIKDMTQFYLQSLLESDPNPPGPLKVPRKATLEVKDACLNSLGGLADMDKTFEDSSGIEGLTTHPTYTALDRMVFFGAATPSYVMPDLDPFLGDSSHPNYRTNRFISGLQDPVGSPLCPKNAAGVNHCTGPHDVLRQRNPGTLFLWEQFGFADASRPLFFTFYKYDREDLFSDLVDVMHYHWPDSTHGAECEPKGGFDRDKPGFNPLYCSEAGLVRYEELLSEALKTDALAAAQQIVKVLRDQRIKSTRYRADQGHARIERRGTELAAFLTRLLFSEKESAAMGLATLDGKRTVLWSDEKTIKNQVTPFDLVANAIKGIDDRFASAKDFSTDELQERQERWKRARSQLVDQFLAVEGSGSGARFKNPAVPKAIVRGLELLREQLNFRCPHREVGEQCTWAKTELTQKVSDVLEDPLFAAIVDLVDELRKDPGRIELERLAQYLLGAIDNEPTLHAVLASAADAIQLLQDRQTLPPILNVLSALAVPDDAAGSDGARLAPGAADISLQLLNVLSRDPDASVPVDDTLMFDRYHVLDHILPNLVKPIDKSMPPETAIEVLIDVAADVHRHDSAEQEPLTAEDYRVIASSLNEFLTDERRGMEQLYTVVRAAEGN
ncbi:MAG: hypothetical protein MUF54_03950, partial [Polyangiaceae bacterium]|nr:hypothetical protein [Polyangiaceae bacterium]